MRLISSPGVGLAPLRGRLNFPGHSLTLIAKVKLALSPGSVARVLEDDASFPCGDVPYEDDMLGLGAPRYASDFVFEKPGADVMLVGHFHAPAQKPVRAGTVALSLDASTTTLSVIGRRCFRGSGPLPTAAAAEPFTRLALRWENAYGGPGHEHNPVGTGHVDRSQLGSAPTPSPRNFALALPRIELPELLFTQLDQPLEPACFAPRSASWAVRRALFGTCDQRWFDARWPWFPEDFDTRYFMSAPPRLQQHTWLRGDETLRFTNMHPQIAEYETVLPNLRALCVVARTDSSGPSGMRHEQVALQLDTLWIDMDAEHAQLVWRGSVACQDADASDIRHAFVDLVPRTLALSAAEVCARAARAIAEDDAPWQITAEEPPALAGAAATKRRDREATQRAALWTRERVEAARATQGALRGVDLSGLDLSDMDLSACDLTHTLLRGSCLDRALLRGSTLTYASLAHASLNDTDLSYAQLADADLSHCRGQRVRLNGAQLTRANLADVSLSALALHDVNLRFAHVSGAELSGVHCEACQLDEATFDGAVLERASFHQCSLSGARFVAAQLAQASFVDCTLNEADFEKAELSGTHVSHSNLDDVTLEAANAAGLTVEASGAARLRAGGVDLRFAEWRQVTCDYAFFEGANLSDARLRQCQLRGADFSAGSLARTHFHGSMLSGAKFARADLSDAQLLGSDCFEASFEGARLLRCNGSGSSFFRAEFLAAELTDFHGHTRNLAGTKLAPKAS
jgi:uncharacterized protein YjbI with pentapeptide repeats